MALLDQERSRLVAVVASEAFLTGMIIRLMLQLVLGGGCGSAQILFLALSSKPLSCPPCSFPPAVPCRVIGRAAYPRGHSL
jgi:hypothetical protein